MKPPGAMMRDLFDAVFRGSGWNVREVWRNADDFEVNVYLSIDERVILQNRNPGAMIAGLAPRPIPRRVYVGPHAPRAAMRRRAGL